MILLLCAGCQSLAPGERAPQKAISTEAPPLPVANAAHYRIVSGESHLRILVFREGPLAEFGHNHVIVADSLAGDVYLAPEFRDSGFKLQVPVSDLRVDPERAREEEGGEFATELSTQARDKTRDNMLGPDVLEAEIYPDIEIRSLGIRGPEWAPDITVRVTLHGVSRDLVVPVAIQRHNDQLSVTGVMELKQTDFNITPFSVMGGGLRVRDRVKVRFRITAVRSEE